MTGSRTSRSRRSRSRTRRWIPAFAAAAAALIAAGILTSEWWLVTVGSLMLPIAAVAGFSRLLGPARPLKRGYRDQSYIGGLLTVFGFSPTDQDTADRQSDPNTADSN
jgi:hypothetical protein